MSSTSFIACMESKELWERCFPIEIAGVGLLGVVEA